VERVYIDTDLLIVGGGTAGCLAAWEARRVGGPNLGITILEKAYIRHSGSLAAGQNALNMYLNQGTPEDFVCYARYDLCGGPVREDILLSVAREVNETVALMEREGLPIKKRPDGRYLNRGKWNVEINGAMLKPITARMAEKAGAEIYNRVYVTNLLKQQGRCVGAVGFGVRDGRFYVVRARAVLLTAGGCAGIYRPNNAGDAHHRIWYAPFNTGASYAMAKRLGCKMVGFECRFIPIRTKDTVAPTGTLAIGMGAPMINALGKQFMKENPKWVEWGGHSAPTPIRVQAFLVETAEHRGPCYMDTTRGDPGRVAEIKEQYVDMSPSLVLYWAANDIDPSKEPVEIDVSGPYIVGAHAAMAGAWVPKEDRMTTVAGLFVAGDALGGAPSRFISGSWTDGRIAARYAVEYLRGVEFPELDPDEVRRQEEIAFAPLTRHRQATESKSVPQPGIRPREMEERMQKIMDEYAGGRTRWYWIDETHLQIARKKINHLRRNQLQYLVAEDLHELQLAWDVINRLDVCQLVIEHLLYRRETRWPGYANRSDCPERNDAEFDCFVCSVWDPETDELTMMKEPYVQLVPGDRMKQSI
jgi:adenylylsulfate reductase subunit A